MTTAKKELAGDRGFSPAIVDYYSGPVFFCFTAEVAENVARAFLEAEQRIKDIQDGDDGPLE